ncbi:MAG TPA: DUF1186 domain-containing protein [Clostridiales bacterium]|nr:DUF1186 domain-containing protein [Clostridiales bacterium]
MNKILKDNMLDVVEHQIKLNKPECAKEEYKRLVGLGISKCRAKEMMAEVLLEEICHNMENNERFNTKRYCRKLRSLESDLPPEDNIYRYLTIQEILNSIENNYGDFPDDALLEIIRRKEEAVPYLTEILKKVQENPKEYAENEDYFGHIYAAYLLAQFRATEAYPAFIQLLKIPKEFSYELLKDTVCESGGRILASIYDGDINPIKNLITDTGLDEYIRGAGVKALTALVLQDALPREEVIEYFRILLTGGLTDENTLVIGDIVSSCDSLYPEDLMGEIKAVHQKGLIGNKFVNFDNLEETIAYGKDWILEQNKYDLYYEYINNTIDELYWWHCFNEDSSFADIIIEDMYIHAEEAIIKSKIKQE